MRLFADAHPLHACYRQVDWRATPLGEPDAWPPALRAGVRMMLDAPVPTALAWGPQRTLLYNAAYAELFPDKHPQALGRPLHEAWAERWIDIGRVAGRAESGESFRIEDMPLARDRWFTAIYAPLRDDDGAVAGSSCTFVETSDRVHAERAVRELKRTLEARVAERTAALARSQMHLLSLFGQTAAGIAETDLDMRIVRVNAKYAEIVGRTQDELTGMCVHDLVHPDDFVHNAGSFSAMLQSGQPIEIENRYVRPDGRVVWAAKMVAPIVEPGASAPACAMAVVIDITERREAEARARESVERLHLATDAARLGIWSWDVADDRANWENDRMYALIGVPRSEEPVSASRFAADFVHPEDVDAFRDSIGQVLATGEPFHFAGRIYRGNDGALRWIEFTGLVHRDGDGRPQRMVGTAADVTEARETLEQLRSAQGRLQATLEAGEIGTWMFDLVQYKLYADANMARLHGIRDEDVKSASPLAYIGTIHPDDLPAVTASLNQARSTGAAYQAIYRVRAADGTERVIHARGRIEFENGVPARLPGVVIDITRQRAIEARFREREERYSALLTAIDEGFCVMEVLFDDAGRAVDHRFVETNPAFERHSGLAGVAGKTARELAPQLEQSWHDLYAGVARTGVPVRTTQYAEPLGRWFDVFVTPAAGGAPHQVAAVFRDITAQKRSEEELRQLAADLAKANRRQSEFLATLAHELRNPLAPIRTALDLMRISPGNLAGNAASLGRVRAMMERQVDHLIHLVNDLLDLARIQRGKIELKMARVALEDVVSNAVETAVPAIQARRHTLDVRTLDAGLVLVADPNRLVQVIGNLLTNAAKYTPEGGRIALTVRRDGDRAVVEVEDNGIGIPSEALASLFQMFSQGRHGMDYAQGGLGIGLSLVKSLVEQHGGTVSATSPGSQQGSLFAVRLPLASPVDDAAAVLPAALPAVVVDRMLRILVADDNEDAAEMLAQSLRLAGHDVAVAHDGLRALALARGRPPDLALLDIGMPGMDGHALARSLRADAALAGAMLVAVTGWGTQEDRERSRAAGFDRHLTKPADLDSVHDIVRAVQAKGATA